MLKKTKTGRSLILIGLTLLLLLYIYIDSFHSFRQLSILIIAFHRLKEDYKKYITLIMFFKIWFHKYNFYVILCDQKTCFKLNLTYLVCPKKTFSILSHFAKKSYRPSNFRKNTWL